LDQSGIGKQPGMQQQSHTEGVSATDWHRGRPNVIRRRFWMQRIGIVRARQMSTVRAPGGRQAAGL